MSNHVHDIGLRDADDPPIWQRALAEDEIIITKDEDFAVRRTLTTRGPTIIWLRIGNSSNQALLKWIEPVWDESSIASSRATF